MAKTSKFIALGILVLMTIVLFASAWNDSATFDEIAHIPAGYSYLKLKDYRLNPEHPPLAKDLSAIPLLFLNLKFPTNVSEWTTEINGQWGMGRIFLYESGNNADKILHWSRFPTMLIALLLGWLLFRWASALYGYTVGLLTLFFYAFSPTIIAHSRYVTTDIGTSLGVFLVIVSFANFLAHQNKKNIILSGLAFGVALLFKFSLITLGPFIFALAMLWTFLNKEKNGFWKTFAPVFYKLILIWLIGLVVIWVVYAFHVWNYPVAKQIEAVRAITGNFAIKPLVSLAVWMTEKPIFRPLGQYLFGLMMMTQRAAGGNSFYFLGNVSSQGTPLYFPILYAVKENFGFHLFTILALSFCLREFARNKEQKTKVAKEWARENFPLAAGILFVIFYLTMSVMGNLNIGVRHILPILPFIYFFIARQTIRWIRHTEIKERYFIVSVFALWIFISTLAAAPHYLSYYNFLGGGMRNGYKVATDSNYDWGQDFKRLAVFVEKNNIDKIAIDYFGGANPQYYLGEKFVPWWSAKGSPEARPDAPKWLAVSINTYQGAIAIPRGDFIREERDNYSWLKGKEPIARAGTSIFIYKF